MRQITRGYYMIPAARLTTVNRDLENVGMGPGFFSIPIVIGSGRSATHYAASCSLMPHQQTNLNKVLRTTDAKQTTQQLSRTGFDSMMSDIAAKERKTVKIQSVADRAIPVIGYR